MTTYLQTKPSHHLTKKPKQRLFFPVKEIYSKKSFFQLILCFYQFWIAPFCFNFHISSFQVWMFARIDVSLYIKKVSRCSPIQPCAFFLWEMMCAIEISPGGSPAVGAAQDFCVSASYSVFHPSKLSWGVAQRSTGHVPLPHYGYLLDAGEGNPDHPRVLPLALISQAVLALNFCCWGIGSCWCD